MDIVINVITAILVSTLSMFRYVALSGMSPSSISKNHFAFSTTFGCFFSLLGYCLFLEEGISSSFFLTISSSFLGASIGSEVNMFFEKRAL